MARAPRARPARRGRCRRPRSLPARRRARPRRRGGCWPRRRSPAGRRDRRGTRSARPGRPRRRPSGTAAPVEIRIASPAWRARSVGAPARDSPTTGRSPPLVSPTTYPSRADESNGGRSPSLSTSSASTRPSASAGRSARGAAGRRRPARARARSRCRSARRARRHLLSSVAGSPQRANSGLFANRFAHRPTARLVSRLRPCRPRCIHRQRAPRRTTPPCRLHSRPSKNPAPGSQRRGSCARSMPPRSTGSSSYQLPGSPPSFPTWWRSSCARAGEGAPRPAAGRLARPAGRATRPRGDRAARARPGRAPGVDDRLARAPGPRVQRPRADGRDRAPGRAVRRASRRRRGARRGRGRPAWTSCSAAPTG